MNNRQQGDFGEKLALKYLKKKGYKIIDTNVVNNAARGRYYSQR